VIKPVGGRKQYAGMRVAARWTLRIQFACRLRSFKEIR
jgi:hypothetical protein